MQAGNLRAAWGRQTDDVNYPCTVIHMRGHEGRGGGASGNVSGVVGDLVQAYGKAVDVALSFRS